MVAKVKSHDYHAPMPGIIFWIIVIAIVLFFKLTTKKERSEMVVNYWMVIVIIGALGFGYQILFRGTISG